MDIEKLIEQLNGYFDGKTLSRSVALNAATILSTLQAGNEKLRAELEQVKAERDAAVEDLLDAAITPCSYCERNPNNGGTCDIDNDNHEMFSCWKWRGIEED